MKIKIVKGEKTIKGDIVEGDVKPFGTSAHIIFSIKHMGKKVNVIIPENTKLVWVLSKEDKKSMIDICKKYANEQNGRLEFHRLKVLEDIEKEPFKLDDLRKVIDMLKESGNKKLADKLKIKYSLNKK